MLVVYFIVHSRYYLEMLDNARPRTFYLDDDIYTKLQWLAKTQALSSSSYLRVLLRRAYEQQLKIEQTKRDFQILTEIV
jgi:hypothetical protein